LFVALADFINAPMPFLIGVLRYVFTDLDVPDDVMVVDIDIDEIRPCSPKPPLFPSHHLDFLSNALQVFSTPPPQQYPLHVRVLQFLQAHANVFSMDSAPSSNSLIPASPCLGLFNADGTATAFFEDIAALDRTDPASIASPPPQQAQVSDVLSPCIDGPKRVAYKRKRMLDVTATHADFIEALARLLRRYREFLLVLDPGADDDGVLPFRESDWLASLEENEVPFCQQLCKTQARACCSC
jgi:hypothetical protein